MKENLDEFKNAYNNNFKFYDENQWYLKQYVTYLTETINFKSIKTVLSLGIGHQVVSDKIISLLNKEILYEYSIVEGSKDIIDNFLVKNKTKKIELHHSYFEYFETEKKYDAIKDLTIVFPALG